MKILPALLLTVFVSFAYAAVSMDDIVQLSRSKTSDDVILQLIEKEGIAKPLSSKDVVYLKQQGVSDRVIQYLVKLSSDKPVQTGKNLRSYYTTNKNGKRIRVVTNLDENGKRMGGEIPPDPAPAEPETAAYRSEPQEIRVIVESNSPGDYPYEEEYVDDRYEMPESFYNPYYTPYDPFYPAFPLFPNSGHRGRRHPSADPNKPTWRYDYSKKFPLVRPQRQRQQTHSPNSARAGARGSYRPIR